MIAILTDNANAFFQSCVVVRKIASATSGAYDERFRAEDYSLWLRLAEFGELHNLNLFISTIEFMPPRQIGQPMLSKDSRASRSSMNNEELED